MKQQTRPGALLSSASPEKWEDRLPSTSIPIYYCLTILPFDTFSELVVASLKTVSYAYRERSFLELPARSSAALPATKVSRTRICGIARAERDGTRAETKIRLSPKRTSPFKSVGASVQSTTGSRGVRISCNNDSNAGQTTFRGKVE